tara:strand:- start:1092 stop:1703 length:612 start_codon:yes stop_codon:yes gene_type:complete
MFDISNWVQDQIQYFLTPLGIFLFIFMYMLWVTFLLPGSWLTMVAGVIYGTFSGTLFVFIGASLGAILTFWSGRTFLRKWTQKKLSNYPKLELVKQKVSKEGLRLIFFTRLSPIFPFSFLNLVYGLSEVNFKDYVISLIAILPGTILYCSLGSLAGDLSKFNEILSNRSDLQSLIFTSMALISSSFAVFLILRAVRNALKEFE